MCNAVDDHGRQTHIMSVIGHQSKVCITQKKVGTLPVGDGGKEKQTNEIKIAIPLLNAIAIEGKTITGDACWQWSSMTPRQLCGSETVRCGVFCHDTEYRVLSFTVDPGIRQAQAACVDFDVYIFANCVVVLQNANLIRGQQRLVVPRTKASAD